jgi:protein SCO1/2
MMEASDARMTQQPPIISDVARRPSSVAWGPIAALVLLAAAIGSIAWLHHRPAATLGGPFRLTDARSGRYVTEKEFLGKWFVVFFGYTHCPDVCPTTLSEIAGALQELGPLAERVQPLFITVDPERDTKEVLAGYTAAIDPRIVGLTGTPEEVAAAASAYHVYVSKRQTGSDDAVDHSAAVYVMDTDGHYRSSFLATTGAAEMARSLKTMLRGEGGVP